MGIDSAEGFNHRLAVAKNVVDDESIAAVSGVDQDHLLKLRQHAGHVEMLPEPDVRKHFPAYVDQVPTFCEVDLVAAELNAFEDICKWQHEEIFTDRNQQTINNGEGQRQLESDGSSIVSRAGHIDRPAQHIDIAPNHVHAYAASRNIRY